MVSALSSPLLEYLRLEISYIPRVRSTSDNSTINTTGREPSAIVSRLERPSCLSHTPPLSLSLPLYLSFYVELLSNFHQKLTLRDHDFLCGSIFMPAVISLFLLVFSSSSTRIPYVDFLVVVLLHFCLSNLRNRRTSLRTHVNDHVGRVGRTNEPSLLLLRRQLATSYFHHCCVFVAKQHQSRSFRKNCHTPDTL